ncbi:pathogenesis-related protein STH-21-like [Syzygium oleosum]|uniref:pathogenesis-related protein STH-21-like n=1 Tax=Syzygium oleosum TaxID=219896 RepID=UPI0024B9CD22|nr:pathogenesis-related protein STH-21-like [Syzygium oleosum]
MAGHLKFLKRKIDALDTENLVCKYTLIEGDMIFDKIEKVVYGVQILASGNGGCVCKMTSEYHTKGDVELKEEDIKQGKEKAMGLYKVVEEYLLANPMCMLKSQLLVPFPSYVVFPLLPLSVTMRDMQLGSIVILRVIEL